MHETIVTDHQTIDERAIDHARENKGRYQRVTQDFAAFPYDQGVLTFDMWQNVRRAMDGYVSEPAIAEIDRITEGGFLRLVAVFGEKVPKDFARVMDLLARGLRSTYGETVKLDAFGHPIIADYLVGQGVPASLMAEDMEGIDPDTYVAPWHGEFAKSSPEAQAGQFKPEHLHTIKTERTEQHGDTTWTVTETAEKYVIPYQRLTPWERYIVLVNLCSLGGYEDSMRASLTRKRTDARRDAADHGAITTLNGRLELPSSKEFWKAFTPERIHRLPFKPSNTDFDDDGRLSRPLEDGQSLIQLTELQERFLGAVFTSISDKIKSGDWTEKSQTITLSTLILDEMGIDPRPRSDKRKSDKNDGTATMAELRYKKLTEEILPPFEPLVGEMPNGSIHRVMTFVRYDPDTETVDLAVSYLWAVARTILGLKAKAPQVHGLFHANAGSGHSDAAFELAHIIAARILQRGGVPDASKRRAKSMTVVRKYANGDSKTQTVYYESAEDRQLLREHIRSELAKAAEEATSPRARKAAEKRIADFEADVKREDYEIAHPLVTYRPKYETIIAECPLVQAELERIKNDPNIKNPRASANAFLKRVFSSAFNIIENETNLPSKYLDLTLPKARSGKGECYDYPTQSTLGRAMVITHRGLTKRQAATRRS